MQRVLLRLASHVLRMQRRDHLLGVVELQHPLKPPHHLHRSQRVVLRATPPRHLQQQDRHQGLLFIKRRTFPTYPRMLQK